MAEPAVSIPWTDRLKAVLALPFGVLFAFWGAAFFVSSHGDLATRVLLALVFAGAGTPFWILGWRLWTGRDRLPVPAGMVRCGGCRRPTRRDELRPMWWMAALALRLNYRGTRSETEKGYCGRCAISQSVLALLLSAIALLAGAVAYKHLRL